MSRNRRGHRKTKRGRPRKDISILVNTRIVYGHRDGSNPSDGVQIVAVGQRRNGRQYVRVRCEVCEEEKIQRLDHVLSHRNHSCGCLEKQAYTGYMSRRVEELLPEDFDAIATMYHQTRSRNAVAVAFNFTGKKKAVIDFVYRQWLKRLETLPQERIAEISEFSWRQGVDATTEKFQMSRSAVYYVSHLNFVRCQEQESIEARRISMVRQLASLKHRFENFDEDAYWEKLRHIHRELAARGTNSEPARKDLNPRLFRDIYWRYPGEFTRLELIRKRTGEVRGLYESLYNQVLNPSARRKLGAEGHGLAIWFLDSFKRTFDNREARGKLARKRFAEAARARDAKKKRDEALAVLRSSA